MGKSINGISDAQMAKFSQAFVDQISNYDSSSKEANAKTGEEKVEPKKDTNYTETAVSRYVGTHTQDKSDGRINYGIFSFDSRSKALNHALPERKPQAPTPKEAAPARCEKMKPEIAVNIAPDAPPPSDS